MEGERKRERDKGEGEKARKGGGGWRERERGRETMVVFTQDKEDSPPPVKTSAPTQQNASYVTLFDFKGQDRTQLTFSKGETVRLTCDQ